MNRYSVSEEYVARGEIKMKESIGFLIENYIFFLVVLLLWINAGGLLQRLKIPVLFLLAFSIPVGSYMLRNKNLYGYWYLKSVDRVNVYTYFLPKLLMKTRKITWKQAEKHVYDNLEVHEYASGNGWEKVQGMLIQEVICYPLSAAQIVIKNCTKTICGLYATHLKKLFVDKNSWQTQSFFETCGSWWQRIVVYSWHGTESYFLASLSFLEVFWNLIRIVFVFYALFLLALKQRWLALVFFGSYILYFIFITFPDGGARLRFTCEMPLVILSAFGIIEGFKIKKLMLKF